MYLIDPKSGNYSCATRKQKVQKINNTVVTKTSKSDVQKPVKMKMCIGRDRQGFLNQEATWKWPEAASGFMFPQALYVYVAQSGKPHYESW